VVVVVVVVVGVIGRVVVVRVVVVGRVVVVVCVVVVASDPPVVVTVVEDEEDAVVVGLHEAHDVDGPLGLPVVVAPFVVFDDVDRRVVVTPAAVVPLVLLAESAPVVAGRSRVMPPTATEPTLSSIAVDPVTGSVALVLTWSDFGLSCQSTINVVITKTCASAPAAIV
jgi:hypothetical protein